ncbi:hypothetical protein JCM8547_002001 [Rhodosporidiobolus lusitaniae]
MLPSSHDHPLSPPIHTALNDLQPLFPDERNIHRSPKVFSDAPLFPASPPLQGAAAELSRRGSAATLFGPKESGGIGLGLPNAVALRQKEDATPLPVSTRSRRPSLSSSSPLPSPDTPIPPLLTLPAVPHLLSTPELVSLLPPAHSAALAQSLSRDLLAAGKTLDERKAELAALERLAEEKGASRGEIDRARVRARAEVKDRHGREASESSEEEKGRADKKGKLQKRRKSKGKEKEQREEWRIETGEFATQEDEEAEQSEEVEEVPAKTEVDLDLEDLTEAISSNAFDLGLPPTSPSSLHFARSPTHADSDTASIRSQTRSLPAPAFSSAATPDDKSETASIASSVAPSSTRPNVPPSSSAPALAAPVAIKPTRPRHASLSARIFGSLAASTSSSSLSSLAAGQPGASSSPKDSSLAHSPSSASLSTSPPSHEHFKQPALPASKTRKNRSGSVRSVSSTASGGGNGYGDWLWKAAGGWGGRGKTPSILEGREGAEPSGPSSAEAAKEVSPDRTAAQEPATAAEQPAASTEVEEPNGSSTSSRRVSTATTTATGSTLATAFAGDPSTPDRKHRSSLSPSPSRSHSSSSGPSTRTRSSPSSPTLSRTRSPAPPPPAFLTASVQGSVASAALSTESGEGEMASSTPSRRGSKTAEETGSESPSRSPSSSRRSLPSEEDQAEEAKRDAGETAEHAEGDEQDESQATIKARLVPSSSSSKDFRPTFVPGVPLYSASSPPSDAAARLASQVQRCKEDDGYVAAARGTLTRALGLGAPSLSHHPSSSLPSSSTISSMPATPSEPNLTLFPRLPALSLSRYALFAQPALSTPATHVSLTASSSSSTTHGASGGSPLVPHTAVLGTAASSSSGGGKSSAGGGGAGASLTMELSTISGEAAPPSLALLKPSYSSASVPTVSGGEGEPSEGEGEEDGPMIDRYGFIYDVRQGMELLKESRKREGRKKEKGQGKTKGKKSKESLKAEEQPAVPRDVLLTPPTELEVHPQLEALREAIGLTPTTEDGPSSLEPASTASPAPSEPPSASATSTSAQLVRAPSSPALSTLSALQPLHTLDDSSSSPAPSVRSSSTSASHAPSTGPQSMRALLVQLRTITDAQEKTQQDAWDAFIRRRQAKLAKLKQKEMKAIAAAAAEEGGKKKERPKTVFLSAGQGVGEAFDWGGGGEAGGVGEDEVWTSENLVGVAQMGTEGKGKKEDWSEFKELVRKGIPIVYRPKIWGECSSANEAREPGVYQELLAQPTQEEEAPCLKQIDMDCHRTFPTNVFFAGNGPGVAKLRNVLVAYSRRNLKIGYCQGMNNLVATLLLTHPAEEDAFWVLVCIIENILPSDYYTSRLLVSRADQEVLRDLVARSLPKIADHLEEHGVELSAITFGWFLSLFTDVLPIQTLLRVWDLFFIHGTVLLFRVALAILKLHESDLLACDSAAALYGLLGTLPTHLYHSDRLLKVACEDLAATVKDREVSLLRSKHVAELQEQMGLAQGDDS